MRSAEWWVRAGWVVASLSIGAASRASAGSLECEPAERYRLGNGLEVVLQRDASLPVVAVVSSVHVGARNDPTGYQGLAHYVEHLLFRGTSHEADVMTLYRDAGATAVNAHTTPDQTDYFAVIPRAQLPRALWIEARRFALGLNALSEEVAASELQVVLREHALGEGSLGRAALDAAFGALFPETHPYHSLSASADSLGQLTLAHARWFHEQGYGADRVRLVLVGDFDVAAVRPMVEEYFGALRPSPAAAPESVGARSHLDPTRLRAEQACSAPSVLGSAAAPHRLLIRVPYRQERLDVLWPVPAGVSVDDALGVLQLWSGDASQAAKEQGLAVDSGASVLQLELAQFLAVHFQIAPGIETRKVEDLLWESLAVFRANGKSAESFRGNAQNLELERGLRRQAPLTRALALAARHCQPTRCDAPESSLDERALDMAPAFGRERALVLQSTYSFGTVLSGPSVEVVP